VKLLSTFEKGIKEYLTSSCHTSLSAFKEENRIPNNDGDNDAWDLSGYDVSKVEIFNRYGSKVFSKSNYTNEWFGQSDNGNELPDGTYYYVIERDGVTAKTGWVYINREVK
jgi:gliding motility-associated-like protein